MRKLILIIDDEFIILESLRIQLERFLPDDIEVETAYSGEEAVELLKEIWEAGWQLLIVISDFNLGDAKGTEGHSDRLVLPELQTKHAERPA